MMETCLDTIFVLNDASEAWRHPVERPSRHQKLDSHIPMQHKALFRYKQYDRLFIRPRLPKVLNPCNRRPAKPLLSVGIFTSA